VAQFAIVVVVSRKKNLFNSAASSGLSGGTRRVLTWPACGALVIMAKAQNDDAFLPSVGSRIWNGFMRWRESSSQTNNAALY
jgi:hypothetical protein